MKTNFRISLLLGAVAMLLSAVTMTSCGDDNDGPADDGKLKYEVVDLGLAHPIISGDRHKYKQV